MSLVDKDASWTEGVELLREILDGLCVPAFAIDRTQSFVKLIDVSILDMMGSNLSPFLTACHGNIRRAAIRIVKTCSWRCMTLLPMIQSVDESAMQAPKNIEYMKEHGLKILPDALIIQEIKRELDAGRLFHEGYDSQGDPLIYFIIDPLNSMGLNLDAVENAALYVVERALQNAPLKPTNDTSWSRCTLLIIMEPQPKSGKTSYWESVTVYPLRYLSLLQRLVPLFSLHYPERLKNVLIVTPASLSSKASSVGPTWIQSWWGSIWSNVGAFTYVPSSTTRNKIHIISNLSDLNQYVSWNSLKQLKCFEFKQL
jgi:hypothetical protein